MNMQILSMWKKIINYFFSWTTVKTFILITINYVVRVFKGAWWLFFIVISSMYVHLVVASLLCWITQFFIIALIRPSLERKDAAYIRRFLHYMSMYLTYNVVIFLLTFGLTFVAPLLAGVIGYGGQFVGYFALLFLCDDLYLPRHQWRELGVASVRALCKSARFVLYTLPVSSLIFMGDLLGDRGICVLRAMIGGGGMHSDILHGVLVFLKTSIVFAMCVTWYTKVRYTQEQLFIS